MRNCNYYRCLLFVSIMLLALVACSAPASANYINGSTVPPATGPTPDEACLPMGSQLWQRWSYCDVASGLFSFSQVDMAVAGPMPIVLRRVYRSEAVDTSANAVLEPFGNGMNFDYNMLLWSESEAANGSGNLQNVDVILADGARVFCGCQGNGNCTPGSGLQFQCTATPSQTFYGATIAYVSSPQSWVLTTKDQTKYSFAYGQSQGALLQSIKDRYANQLTVTRTSSNITLSSSNGRSITLTLSPINGENVVTQAQDSAGHTTSYGYTTYGSGSSQTSMTSSTNLDGKTTNYTWYTPVDVGSLKPSQKNGQLIEETDVGYTALGSGYQFAFLTPPQSQGYYQITYSMNGGKVAQADIYDPQTYHRHLAFNSSGYLTSEVLDQGTGHLNSTSSYTRDTTHGNFVTQKVDALGRQTQYGYDFTTTNVGDLLSVTRFYNGTSNSFSTSFTYTSTFHQLQTITDPLGSGHTTYFNPCSPDTNGFVCQFKDAVGNTVTFTPVTSPKTTGQVSTATDAAGDQTTFGYDPTTFDLTSVTDPNGKKTSATYDGDGRLTSVTDPLRNKTSYQLDYIGNVTQVTDARNGPTKYGYDDVGNLLTVTDANNHATATNTYDLRNRLTENCDALNRCVTYDSYDADDNLTQHTNAAREIDQFKYDNLNRRSENDYTVVNGTPTDKVTLSYDLGDRLYQAVDQANGAVTRQFGQAGSPTGTNTTEASSLDFISQEVTPNGTVKYTPDLAGRRTSLTFGSLTYNYGYDNANKLTSVSVPSTWSVTKNFNYSAGRLGSITLPNGLAVSYTYDNDSHVKSITYGTLGGLSYTYDADGRRTGVSGGFAATSIPLASLALTYNNDNSLKTIGGTTVTNGPGGNITAMTGSCIGCNGTLSYDPQGNLQESYLFIGGQWVDRFNYYDALGRLQSSAITIGSNTTPVNAVYDGFNVLETYNASAYVLSLLGLGLDELYLEDFNGTVQSSVLKDALGSEVGLTNPTKGLTDTYSYEPYGVPTHTYGTTIDPGQFAGIPYDVNSGLYYMRHRWYLPAIGRFISRDPIGIAGGINVYAYANDDPVDFKRPHESRRYRSAAVPTFNRPLPLTLAERRVR